MSRLDRLAEVTPTRHADTLTRLADALGCARPQYCPVMAQDAARYDTCVSNVAVANREWGGAPCFGWVLRECPGLWISARFHAVRRTAGGLFVDETPDQTGIAGGWTMFAHDSSLGPDFNFRQRPPTRRISMYRPAQDARGGAVRDEGRVTSRSQPRQDRADPLAIAIDDYIATLANMDALYEPTAYGQRCVDPNQIAQRFEKIARAQRRLLRLLEPSPWENGLSVSTLGGNTACTRILGGSTSSSSSFNAPRSR